MENALNWFEIPVENLPRAVRFYEALLATTLEQESFLGTEMAVIPSKGVSGALLATPRHKPTGSGTVVYLHAGQGSRSLDDALARARDVGGEILVPVTDIGDMGSFAVIRDSEGNAIGLHAPR